MSVMVSYNVAIKKKIYEGADIIRLNSPWYTEEELLESILSVDKPKFLDINIKNREKAKKTDHNYEKLLKMAGKYGVEWVGISNVEGSKIYAVIEKMLNNKYTKICAKIETELGCWHSDDIIHMFDGIMVDTEDLAFDIGWKRASEEKDRIYEDCKKAKKPHFRMSGVIFEGMCLEKTVYTYGAWDILHPGHINMLETAKSYGDRLIVGVVGDKAIKKLKGNDRPIQDQETRLRMVSKLRCVDHAIAQEEYDPTQNLEMFKPDILVKGDDWEHIPGEEWIKQHGGKLIKPPYTKGPSTSKIIKKIRGDK